MASKQQVNQNIADVNGAWGSFQWFLSQAVAIYRQTFDNRARYVNRTRRF